MAVDGIAERHGFSDWKAKSGALIADGRLGTQKVILLKPQRFMNKSGLPVAEIARLYKIPPDDIFVFYDEIDLAIGKLRASSHVARRRCAISLYADSVQFELWLLALGVGDLVGGSLMHPV